MGNVIQRDLFVIILLAGFLEMEYLKGGGHHFRKMESLRQKFYHKGYKYFYSELKFYAGCLKSLVSYFFLNRKMMLERYPAVVI